MWSVRRPSSDEIQTFLVEQRGLPLSYPNAGATRGALPAGWTTEHHRRRLGTGAACFVAARDAARAWRMFPAPWASIHPDAPPVADLNVVVLLKVVGVWWLNAMRVVYLDDEPRRFVFACGTLPAHVAIGEESFSIHHTADDSVWFEIRAFTRPRLLAARVASPLTRGVRTLFVRDSLAAMTRAVERAGIVRT